MSETTSWGDTDPIRKAAEHAAQPKPKRFFKRAEIGTGENGETILLLDDRQARTPAKNVLHAPNETVGRALAAEWDAQVEFIDPGAMPLTRLLNSAIDGVSGQMDETRDTIASFGETDLLCYRASHPEALVSRQTEAWDPVIERMEHLLSHRPVLAAGVMHVDQPDGLKPAISEVLSTLDPFRLAAAFTVTSITGSAFLALDAIHAGQAPDSVWHAAHIDEDWQIEQWGEDSEATRRRAFRRTEFDAAMLVLRHAK